MGSGPADEGRVGQSAGKGPTGVSAENIGVYSLDGSILDRGIVDHVVLVKASSIRRFADTLKCMKAAARTKLGWAAIIFPGLIKLAPLNLGDKNIYSIGSIVLSGRGTLIPSITRPIVITIPAGIPPGIYNLIGQGVSDCTTLLTLDLMFEVRSDAAKLSLR